MADQEAAGLRLWTFRPVLFADTFERYGQHLVALGRVQSKKTIFVPDGPVPVFSAIANSHQEGWAVCRWTQDAWVLHADVLANLDARDASIVRPSLILEVVEGLAEQVRITAVYLSLSHLDPRVLPLGDSYESVCLRCFAPSSGRFYFTISQRRYPICEACGLSEPDHLVVDETPEWARPYCRRRGEAVLRPEVGPRRIIVRGG